MAKQGAGSLSALFSASLTQLQSVGFADHLWFHPASQGFQQSLRWNNMSSVWTTYINWMIEFMVTVMSDTRQLLGMLIPLKKNLPKQFSFSE